jgi:glycosyltransferase involved in cell wall biosynthesis
MTLAASLRREIVQRQLVQLPLRWRARLALRAGRVQPGVTVVTVNWNSEPFLRVCLGAVKAFSPASTRIMVVDNHSTDGSLEYLRTTRDVRVVRLPANIGHEVALDIGFLLARTEYVISLDVDAFPISERWIETLLEPLRNGADVAGAHVRGGFVHPCCLAMRLRDFVTRDHSFVARRAGRWATDASDITAPAWDTGYKISLREPRRFLIDRTHVHGPGDIGSVFGDVVYHNFYSVRFDNPKQQFSPDELAADVSRAAALDAWDEATARLLPRGLLESGGGAE